MAGPLRISYRQDADYFLESQTQLSFAGNRGISEKIQNRIWVLLVVGILLLVAVQEAIKTRHILVPALSAAFLLLILSLVFRFLEQRGIGTASTDSYSYEPTEKDRLRLEKRLARKIGAEDMLVTWEFDDNGMRFMPVTPKSANYSWTNVSRIVETPRGLLIFVRRWAHMWFPRAAFASPADYSELCQIITLQVRNFQRLGNAWAYVALGSNLGDSKQNILKAIERLQQLSDEPLVKSSLWQTTPVDCPPGSPMFVNAVIGLIPHAGETPASLLQKLASIEVEFGRQPKTVLNEPRPLDLDLIAFRGEQRNSADLVLPHPRAHQRRFVLEPLNEIAPDLVLGGQSKSVAELLRELPEDKAVRRI